MNKRIAVEPVVYTENEELGELIVIQDLLPSAQALVERAKRAARRKVTLTLDNASIDDFKQLAQAHNVSYQKRIRTLLDDYVQQQKHQPTPSSGRK